jgi:hypothetical protein
MEETAMRKPRLCVSVSTLRDPTPSDNDITVTLNLHQAGELLQLPLLDHIVFTQTTYYSFLKTKKQSSLQTQG